MHTGPKMSVSSIGGNVIRTREIVVKQRQEKEYKKSIALSTELSLSYYRKGKIVAK